MIVESDSSWSASGRPLHAPNESPIIKNLFENYVYPLIDAVRSGNANVTISDIMNVTQIVKTREFSNDLIWQFMHRFDSASLAYLETSFQTLSTLTGTVLLSKFYEEFNAFSQFSFHMFRYFRSINNLHIRGGISTSITGHLLSTYHHRLFLKVFPRLRDALVETIRQSRDSLSIDDTTLRVIRQVVRVTCLVGSISVQPEYKVVRTSTGEFEWEAIDPLQPYMNPQNTTGPRSLWRIAPAYYKCELEEFLIKSAAVSFANLHDRIEFNIETTPVPEVQNQLTKVFLFEDRLLNSETGFGVNETFKLVMNLLVSQVIDPRIEFLMKAKNGGLIDCLKRRDVHAAVKCIKFLSLGSSSNVGFVSSEIQEYTRSSLLELFNKHSVMSSTTMTPDALLDEVISFLSFFIYCFTLISTSSTESIGDPFTQIVYARADPDFIAAAVAASTAFEETRKANKKAQTSAIVSDVDVMKFISEKRPVMANPLPAELTVPINVKNPDVIETAKHATVQLLLSACKITIQIGLQKGVDLVIGPSMGVSKSLPSHMDKFFKHVHDSHVLSSQPSSDVSEDEVRTRLCVYQQLIRSLHDRDVCFELMRSFMAKRLLSFTGLPIAIATTLIDFEQFLLSKLEEEISVVQTNKLARMLSDYHQWPATNLSFKRYLKGASVDPDIHELEVRVLQKHSWILKDELMYTAGETSLVNSFLNSGILPFGSVVDAFSIFYEKKYSGRQLSWSMGNSTCNVAAYTAPSNASNSTPSVILTVPTLLAGILLLFNDSPFIKSFLSASNSLVKNSGLMVADIARALSLPVSEVARLLVSLTVGSSQKVLLKHNTPVVLDSKTGEVDESIIQAASSVEGGYKDVKASTIFSINEAFSLAPAKEEGADVRTVMVQLVKKVEQPVAPVAPTTATPAAAPQPPPAGRQSDDVEMGPSSSSLPPAMSEDIPEVVSSERRYVLDAVVVKLMKKLREITEVELKNQTREACHLIAGFKPLDAAIEKAIEGLIQKEFIERDSSDSSKILYVP